MKSRILGLPAVQVIAAGITDKNETELLQLGNVITIEQPPTVLAAADVWINGSDETPGPGGGASTNVGVILQARSESASNPECLSILINPPIFNSEGQNILDFDLKVRAIWGVGSDRSTAVIDILNGAQFSVVASELVIQGLYTLLAAPATPIPIQLGASIGSYPRAGSEFGPAFTARFGQILATNSRDIVIPSYAKAVTIYAATQAAAPVPSVVTIGFLTPAAATPFINVTQGANDIRTYPLPNEIDRIRLTAPAGNDMRGFVRFDLAL